MAHLLDYWHIPVEDQYLQLQPDNEKYTLSQWAIYRLYSVSARILIDIYCEDGSGAIHWYIGRIYWIGQQCISNTIDKTAGTRCLLLGPWMRTGDL